MAKYKLINSNFQLICDNSKIKDQNIKIQDKIDKQNKREKTAPASTIVFAYRHIHLLQ